VTRAAWRRKDRGATRDASGAPRRGAGAGGDLGDEPGLLADAYARHGTAVYGLARHIAGAAAAEGVTVDTFVALWRTPTPLRAATGALSVRAWLLAFAHRRAVQVLRSDSERRCELARMAPGDVEEESWERAGAQARRLLSTLAADERRSMVLAVFGGHACREISEILGRPEDAVKADLRAGLSRLRDQTHRARDGSFGHPESPARRRA